MERPVPVNYDDSRVYLTNNDGISPAFTPITMAKATQSRSRARSRGMTAQSVLAVCAVMGCFVYPLSLVMRSTGVRIAQESEKGHDVMLDQAR